MASPGKRAREREGQHLRVVAVDKGEETEPVADSLRSFVKPCSRDDFFKSVFRQRALAVRVHPSHRDERLSELRTAMNGFRPLAMLENSNSEALHVWMRVPAGNGTHELKSVRLLDAQAAKTCYDAGHALYFRASEELEGTLLPALARDLGFGFAAYHRDGARRGEIETFVAKAGHVTEWHTDFQENFTVQLMGVKKWSFYRSGVKNTHRACATHFNGSEHARTLHSQLQTVRYDVEREAAGASPSDFTGVPADIEEECESVVLQPGDTLYHPAGIWHKVEAVGDGPSLSINLSFFPASWAELVAGTLQHALLAHPEFRERIRVPNAAEAQQHLASLLPRAASVLGMLQPNDILPRAVCDIAGQPDPRQHCVVIVADDGDCGVPVCGPAGISAMEQCPVSRVRRNPLAVVSRTTDAEAFPVPHPLESPLVGKGPDGTGGSEDEEGEEDEEDDGFELEDEDGNAVTGRGAKTADVNATVLEGFVRFDLTSNFLAEDGAYGAPAVAATFFVDDEQAEVFERAVVRMPRGVGISTSELEAAGLSAATLSVLLALGYIGPAAK